MAKLIKDLIGRNLRKPDSGLGGWFVSKFLFEKKNVFLEHNAVRLCEIQPDHKVLEVGFGPGVGLKAAANIIEDGSGTVHGAEISDAMIKAASKKLQTQISSRKIQLKMASVSQLPFADNSIDRIFHVNCFYFWPDLDEAARELYRVLKPQSRMVATLNPVQLKRAKEKGFFKYTYNTEFEPYVEALKQNGFSDVQVQDLTDADTGQQFQAAIANLDGK